MKLIHCADVHLDAKMETNLPPEAAAERRAELTRTFVSLLRLAAEQRFSAVLISGDLFDTQRVTARTRDLVLSQIAALPALTVFYLPGNHEGEADCLHGTAIPTNLKVFNEDWTSYPLEDVMISGAAPRTVAFRETVAKLPQFPGKKHVVLLHGELGTGADQIDLRALSGRGVTYLALGHLHTFSWERTQDGLLWCYPGCLEGRGFDECGEKGYVTLDLSQRSLEPVFHPFACRTLHRVELDVTGCEKNSEVLQRMEAALAPISAQDLVEAVLKGSVPADAQISETLLTRWLRDRFYCFQIKNRTKIETFGSDGGEVSLRGCFLRKTAAQTALTDVEKEAVVRFGLCALAGEEIEA